jgi:hypothetical protein
VGESRVAGLRQRSLCLAVDAIDDDLRRLVEYPNKVTLDQVRVTALQLAYARHGDLEILIPSTYGGELAAAKTRTDDRRKPRWTRETFLEAIATDADRQIAERYFSLVEALPERPGGHALVWYGNKPGGGIFLHPYRLRYAPFQLWVNSSGRLMIYGNWNNWPTIAGHDGFADLAKLLGQNHQDSSKSIPADTLDTDTFWTVALTTATAINQPPTP